MPIRAIRHNPSKISAGNWPARVRATKQCEAMRTRVCSSPHFISFRGNSDSRHNRELLILAAEFHYTFGVHRGVSRELATWFDQHTKRRSTRSAALFTAQSVGCSRRNITGVVLENVRSVPDLSRLAFCNSRRWSCGVEGTRAA